MTQKILLFALLSGSLIWNTAKATETEPNNTKATANVLTLNGSNTGAIGAADEDWWSVTTTGDGKLDVTIAISNGLNMWCQIYDNDGVTLLSSGYTAGTATISKDGLAAGTYYLRLYPYFAGQLPAYTVSNVLTVPAQANDNEPNGTKAQAKTLPLNSSKTGHSNYYYNNVKDSADWYKVTTNADGRLRLTMTSANGQNVWAYLYDNDGTTVLASGYTAGSAVVVNRDGLAAGTYYIRVNTYYTSEWAPYTLADSLFSPTQPNDTEPNGTAAQALTLPLNGSVTGHNNYLYNGVKDTEDWYKVTTPADGRLRLTMASGNGQNVWAYLYDNDGTTLLASSYTTGTADVVNKDGLAAGTYYVKVKTYYDYEFAPYTLSDSLFSPAQANDAEPNDTRAQALTLPLNGSKTGHTNYYYNLLKDGEDWYKLTTTSDGMISVTIQSHNSQNVWAYLYDNDGTTLLIGDYTTATKTISYDGLQAGTYYIKVKTYYSYEWAPYTLSNTLATYTNTNDGGSSNDYFSKAKTLPANNTTTGHVNFYYNGAKDAIDYWKINYTGDGALTLLFTQENRIKYGSADPTWFRVFKDTAGSPISTNYYYASSGDINLTGLTQGYYYIQVYTYYNGTGTNFSSYAITPTFTQKNKAKIVINGSDTAVNCDSLNQITFKCTKSQAPYKVQLKRYGVNYGSAITVNNSSNFNVTGLPAGSYSATAFGDGATGNASGKSDTIALVPTPTGTATTFIKATTTKTSWVVLPCVKYYTVQYRKTGDLTWLTANTVGNVDQLKLTGLTAATQYEWQVQAVDSANGIQAKSAFTASLVFTTDVALFAADNSNDENSATAAGSQALTAYPNPAATQFTLQYKPANPNEKVSLLLKDLNGKTVWNKNNTVASSLNGTLINVSTLSPGIYMLMVMGENNTPTLTRKIVVSR